jgi:hypothetical protein
LVRLTSHWPSLPPSRLRLILPVIVMTATFVAFLPALRAGFLDWDDDVNLLENPYYRGLGRAQLIR